MMLFCLVNPGLNAPFDIEFDRRTDIAEFPEDFVANYLNAGNLLAMPGRYYFQRQLYWNQIYNVYRMYSQVNAGDRPSLENVRAYIRKKTSCWH